MSSWMERLRELVGGRNASDERRLEEAEQAKQDDLAGTDFEGRKDDIRTDEFFPGERELE